MKSVAPLIINPFIVYLQIHVYKFYCTMFRELVSFLKMHVGAVLWCLLPVLLCEISYVKA